jgi:general secretion pathway protein D
MRGYRHFMLLLVVFAVGCTAGNTTVYNDSQFANQGFEALSQGRYGDAETYLDKALAKNPNNPYVLLNLGVVYQNTRRPLQARMLYEKVIHLNPTEIVGRSNIEGKAGATLVDLAKENLRRL